MTMLLRKLTLAAVAAASLAVPALAPTSASAWGGHGHGGWHGGGWHHGGGWGGPRVFVGGPAYGYGYGGFFFWGNFFPPLGARRGPGLFCSFVFGLNPLGKPAA